MARMSRSKEGEVKSLRQAALEFRERLRKRALSVDSTWNAAIHECMELLGPVCRPSHRVEECQKCWIHDKMRRALRLEAAVYVTLKERMRSSLERLRRTCTLRGSEYETYAQALDDVDKETKELLEDFE